MNQMNQIIFSDCLLEITDALNLLKSDIKYIDIEIKYHQNMKIISAYNYYSYFPIIFQLILCKINNKNNIILVSSSNSKIFETLLSCLNYE